MTQRVSGSALLGLSAAYGLQGEAPGQITELDDEHVSQVLDVGVIARRSRVPFRGGIFWARLANTHAVAGELQSILNPYEPDPAQSGFPFEVVDSTQWDIWYIGTTSFASAGDGALVTWGMLTLDAPAAMQAMSQTATGGTITPADVEVGLVGWRNYDTFDLTPGDYPSTVNAPYRNADHPWRMDPLEQLSFRSQVTAACTVQAAIRFAIFPISLGQDAVL